MIWTVIIGTETIDMSTRNLKCILFNKAREVFAYLW